MNKLEFNYASMNSGKSLALITRHYMLSNRGFSVMTFKPSLDTRSEKIETRLGLSIDCITLKPEEAPSDYILRSKTPKPDYILCDEAQFLTKEQVWDLAFLVDNWHIDVVCYGLKLDWRGELFEGSHELVKISDELHPIENLCKIEKGAPAFFHIKHTNLETSNIEVGFEETYSSVSRKVWKEWYDKVSNDSISDTSKRRQ